MTIINGRYQLHSKLGEGGMGVVHLATDRLASAEVALKQVYIPLEQLAWLSELASKTISNLRLALAKEFQILAGLRHPYIISVLDYGFDMEQQPFYTMSYLPDVETILEAGIELDLEGKMALIKQTLQALAYLHRRGILHRDVKPTNVLVCNNTVRLVDFGLSSFKGQNGSSGGTLLYMSPEMLAKSGAPFVEATDLYSVGVIAYELLAERHPFDITSGNFADQVLQTEPDLSRLKVDEPLAQVIGRLLAKKPGDRYASAEACLAAISTALGEPAPEESEAIRESYLQAATFVGREAEMAQLKNAFEQAQAGRGTAVLIGGESGVGKSRLLEEFRIQALVDGALVVTGQGVHEGGDLPYKLWRDAVRHLLLTSDEIDDLTAGVLATVVSDIASLLGRPIPAPPQLEGQASEERLFHAITTLFQHQKQTVVLLLEDLQWAIASLDILTYLIRQVADLPLLIIGSYRDDERPELASQLSNMQPIKLRRLSEAAITRLSLSMLGEVGQRPEILTLLQRETEGNAFFLVEVVRALAEEAGQLGAIGETALPEKLLPQGIQSIVDWRLAHIPAEAEGLLQLAAVAGREIDQPVISELAADADVISWLNQCIDAAVLEVNENKWRFTHDKLREGVIDRLTPQSLVSHHQQVAFALEAIYAEDPNQAANLVYHWQQAGNDMKERVMLIWRESMRWSNMRIMMRSHSSAVP